MKNLISKQKRCTINGLTNISAEEDSEIDFDDEENGYSDDDFEDGGDL